MFKILYLQNAHKLSEKTRHNFNAKKIALKTWTQIILKRHKLKTVSGYNEK